MPHQSKSYATRDLIFGVSVCAPELLLKARFPEAFSKDHLKLAKLSWLV